MRTAASLVLVAALVGSLAACAPTGTADSADCTTTPSGSVSDAVDVTGDFGTKPEVTFEFPTAATTTERTVVIPGDGDTAVEGDTVNLDFTLINGATGEELAATEYAEESPTPFTIDETIFVGILKTLECTQVGSRVVGVIPPVDSFGDTGSTDLGVEPGQDIVFVIDLVSIDPPVVPPLAQADGVEQPATEGFPEVVLAEDGTPTVTIPDTDPPTELEIALLKEGDGAEVQDGDQVVVHYVGVNWNTKEIFDSSWERGEPATFGTDQVIAGFSAALVGQKVGSQVIAIIPPDQGYGDAGSPPSIGGTDTLVFVVDILGIG